jgi:hypothetical protein
LEPFLILTQKGMKFSKSKIQTKAIMYSLIYWLPVNILFLLEYLDLISLQLPSWIYFPFTPIYAITVLLGIHQSSLWFILTIQVITLFLLILVVDEVMRLWKNLS